MATMTVIDVVSCKAPASTGASINQTLLAPQIQLRAVSRFAVTLVEHVVIPVKSMGIETMHDQAGCARVFPGGIQVFYPQFPRALVPTCIKITGYRTKE